MKKYAFFTAIAVFFLLTSCSNDDLGAQNDSKEIHHYDLNTSTFREGDNSVTPDSTSIEGEPVKTNGRD